MKILMHEPYVIFLLGKSKMRKYSSERIAFLKRTPTTYLAVIVRVPLTHEKKGRIPAQRLSDSGDLRKEIRRLGTEFGSHRERPYAIE